MLSLLGRPVFEFVAAFLAVDGGGCHGRAVCAPARLEPDWERGVAHSTHPASDGAGPGVAPVLGTYHTIITPLPTDFINLSFRFTPLQ